MAPVKSKDAEAPKKSAVKAAPKKVEEMFLQFQGGQWDLAEVKERVLASYVAEGHRASAIKKLTIYPSISSPRRARPTMSSTTRPQEISTFSKKEIGKRAGDRLCLFPALLLLFGEIVILQ